MVRQLGKTGRLQIGRDPTAIQRADSDVVDQLHLVFDNYAVHSAYANRHFLEELGHRTVFHFLPPDHPDARSARAFGLDGCDVVRRREEADHIVVLQPLAPGLSWHWSLVDSELEIDVR